MTLLYYQVYPFYDTIYRPFFGSHFLFLSGPFRFIIDKKEVIIDGLEEALAEFLPIIYNKKMNYEMSAKQKDTMHNLFKIQEKYLSPNYMNMDIKILYILNILGNRHIMKVGQYEKKLMLKNFLVCFNF
jgi:hypothetical protein